MTRVQVLLLVLASLLMVSCSTAAGTEVRAEVAANFSQEGINPGDPLAGAVLYLYDGDTIIVETVLDGNGAAVVAPDPGVYTVQVSLDSKEDALCFWGETIFDVRFPSSSLVDLEAGYICAGQ